MNAAESASSALISAFPWKAISLTQPWASLVALGEKRIETRSWRTAYTGRIAIHAAKALPKSFYGLDNHFATVGCLREASGHYSGRELPRGAIVAIARLVNCVSTDSPSIGQTIEQWGGGRELEWGDYSPGRWAWLLADIVQLEEPVPARGALGLWDWTYPLEVHA